MASWSVGVWTANDDEAIALALSVGAAAVITDVPIAARARLGPAQLGRGHSSLRRRGEC